MEKNPSLSVIIPVHNTASYIERAVDHILAQTYPGLIEIILVENGSSDNSFEIISRLATLYDNVVALISPKTGPSEARNYGVTKAKGQLVAFADSDDYIDPDMYERLINAKTEFKADCAYCNYLLEFSDGSRKHSFADTGKTEAVSPEQTAYDTIMEISNSSPCVRILDRDFLLTHKFPEGQFYEDHDCIYRWMADCRNTVHIDVPFYHYCIREGSTTTSTIGNPSKIIDLFHANLGRIGYIAGEKRFSALQRKTALRHVRSEIFNSLKQLSKIAVADKDSSLIDKLKTLFAEYRAEISKLSYSDMDLKMVRRILYMRFAPEKFIRKLARR